MHVCWLIPAQDLAWSILSNIFYQSEEKELFVLITSWHQEKRHYLYQSCCALLIEVQLRESPAHATAMVTLILDDFVEFLFCPVLKEQ